MSDSFCLSIFHHNFPLLYNPNNRNKILSIRSEQDKGYVLINPLTRLEGKILFSLLGEVQANLNNDNESYRLIFDTTNAILKLANFPRTQYYINKIRKALPKIATMSVTILDSYQISTDSGELTTTPVMSLLHKGRYNDLIVEFNKHWIDLNTKKWFIIRETEDTIKARSETVFNFYSLLLAWKSTMEKQGHFIRTVKDLTKIIGISAVDERRLRYKLKQELENVNKDFNTDYKISYFSDCVKVTN